MKLHTTIGVYASGDHKMNGVDPDDLKFHIEYNKINRFGRALFVDGKCVHNGYLSVAECELWERKIKDDPKRFTAKNLTIPYQ